MMPMTSDGFCEQCGPLDDLLVQIHCHDDVPVAWIAAHAPDGSLEPLWSGCDHVQLLVDLAALTADPRDLARAACECARTVVMRLPPERRQEAHAALEVAERWSAGNAGLDELADAADATDHAYARDAAPLVSTAAVSVHAAVATAATAAGHATPWYDTPQVNEAASHAAVFAAAALRWAKGDAMGSDGDDRTEVCPPLAAILRAELTCPTLDQLRDAIERLRSEGDD